MTDVKIKSFNQLYLLIETNDKGIHYELNDHFSFFVEGYKHMQLYKEGKWDGKKKLYHISKRQLYKGLLIDLIKFLDSRDYSYEIDKKSIRPIDVRQDIKDFFGEFSTDISDPPARDYQRDATIKALTYNKAMLLSPTGSGKSLIIYLLVKFLLEHTEGKILITVPTISLVTQLAKDIQSYQQHLDESQWIKVHKISGGAGKDSDERVYLSTWQSVYKQDVEWFSQFGSYICDEAHLADAASITGIIEKMAHADFKFGLTGTLEESKTHELVLRGMFGPVIKTATTAELMERGILTKLEVEMLKLNYSQQEIKSLKKSRSYDDEIKWLVGNPIRNDIIIEAAMSQPNNTLVLFNFVEGHGEELFKKAGLIAEERGKQIFVISGKDKADERERVRNLFEYNDNCILFASYGTFSTGVDLKNLHTIIFAHPYKSKIRNLQSIGRGLRLHSSKSSAKLIDIVDDLTYNKKHNVVLLHAIERMKIYEREKFEYRVIDRDL